MNDTYRHIFKITLLGYLALLFNGEIYRWSWTAFIMPTLVIMYILYILLMYILVKKANFNGLKIFLTGSFIGLMLEIFYSKSIFVNPILFGVNWLSVVIQFFYWGMAATLPFYIYKNLSKKSFKHKFKVLNIGIVTYLVLEFTLGSILNYSNPSMTLYVTWVWIITGLPLGLLTFVTAIKHKDFIKDIK